MAPGVGVGGAYPQYGMQAAGMGMAAGYPTALGAQVRMSDMCSLSTWLFFNPADPLPALVRYPLRAHPEFRLDFVCLAVQYCVCVCVLRAPFFRAVRADHVFVFCVGTYPPTRYAPYPLQQMQAGLYPGQVPQAMAQAMGMPPVSMSMVGAMPGTGSDGLAAATAVVPAAMLTGTGPAVPTSAPASAPGAIAAAPSHFEFPVAAGVCM